jgi:sugar lactone lactonase YvrE
MGRSLAIFLFLVPLSAQDFSDLKVEKIAGAQNFTDGPVWSREGFLIFCDVPSNKLMKFTPGEGTGVYREDTHGAGGLSIDDKGRLYLAESRGRRVIRIDKKGKLDVLAEKWEGKRLNGPNDLVVSKGGDVYFTDPAFGKQADARELDFYGVYHITPKGEMELVAKPAGRPNGIALSPSGKVLYVANTDERNIRAYDLAKNGSAGNERIVISSIEGAPGGVKTDEKGNLYVAGKGLLIYSPEGKPIHTIEMTETPSNCAFGDPDFQTLYISARTSMYRVRLNVKGFIQH